MLFRPPRRQQVVLAEAPAPTRTTRGRIGRKAITKDDRFDWIGTPEKRISLSALPLSRKTNPCKVGECRIFAIDPGEPPRLAALPSSSIVNYKSIPGPPRAIKCDLFQSIADHPALLPVPPHTRWLNPIPTKCHECPSPIFTTPESLVTFGEHTRPRVLFPAPSPETSAPPALNHFGDIPSMSLMIGITTFTTFHVVLRGFTWRGKGEGEPYPPKVLKATT
jgi:hypothetical protein